MEISPPQGNKRIKNFLLNYLLFDEDEGKLTEDDGGILILYPWDPSLANFLLFSHKFSPLPLQLQSHLKRKKGI